MRFLAQAGVLDTVRYRKFPAMELGVSVASISAMLMGRRGETLVPIASSISISPRPEIEAGTNYRVAILTSLGGAAHLRLSMIVTLIDHSPELSPGPNLPGAHGVTFI